MAETKKSGKRSLNLTGTPDKVYDLDEIQSNNRLNSDKELVIHVHEYALGENPNPSNLKIGQIWISKRV
jgi:hypothetical protein